MKEQVTLGEMIILLKRAPATAPVHFDFCRFVPTTLASERGDYSHLALGYRSIYGPDAAGLQFPTAGGLLAHCKEALGKTYQGWKGGDYVATESTPLWVANKGEWNHTAIVDVTVDPYDDVHIHTEHRD